MIPARPFLIALLLSASAGGASAADDPDKGLVACIEKARQAEATCAKLTDEPAQRLECFQKARAEQLGCLEHALSDAPTGATAPVSPPEPSRRGSPDEQPSKTVTSEPPSQANPHENAGQPAENTQANSPANPPAEPQMSTQETAPKTTQDNAATNAPPPGACKPIGLTLSGKVVFPLECRDFIERYKAMTPPTPLATRPAAAEAKPAAPEAKPSTVETKLDTADVKPATAEEKPTGSTEKPAAVEEKPTVVEAKPLPAETKPAAAETKPPAMETKPAAAGATKPAPTEETPAAKQSANATADDGRPAVKPDDTAPSRKRAENSLRERSAGPPGCTHFRSYNAASGTYRDFDGRTRPCR
jgi:hypothetical protein